jgi:hypothetical protein
MKRMTLGLIGLTAVSFTGCATDVSTMSPFVGEVGHDQTILRDCVLVKSQTFLPFGPASEGPYDVLDLREAGWTHKEFVGVVASVPAGSRIRVRSVSRLTGDDGSDYEARIELLAPKISSDFPIIYIWGLDHAINLAPWEPLPLSTETGLRGQ